MVSAVKEGRQGFRLHLHRVPPILNLRTAQRSTAPAPAMGSAPLLLALPFLLLLTTVPEAQAAFTCKVAATTTCNALVGYVSPNTTALSSIQTLFDVKNLRTLLGANNLANSTSGNYTVLQKNKVIIPFRCRCSNGTGASNGLPLYTVQTGDGLYHIGADVFAGLVTVAEIQAANNISNPDLIEVGQELWIPLPCSCDEVNGTKVLHYGHVVEAGSSVELIAERYGTTEATLLSLNGISDPKSLKAGAVLDVPLKACKSVVGNTSLDYPLLVANGTYIYTANSCVVCKCDSANNWTLQCEPSQLMLPNRTCPNIQCEGGSLSLGQASDGCNRTTCAYAGYTNQTILTSLVVKNTCIDGNDARMIGLQGWSWAVILISCYLLSLGHRSFHLR